MKLRNHLLALAILLGFLAMGTLYVRNLVVQRPFAIILVVSDACLSRHLSAARLYSGGAESSLYMEREFTHTALMRNDSADFAVPDSGSAASAIATGRKTRNHQISMDGGGNALETILELARKEGRKVGLVTNGKLSDPSSAAFFTHKTNAADAEGIVVDLVEKRSLDLVMGGGLEDFVPREQQGRRADGRSLLTDLKSPMWSLIRTRSELEAAAPAKNSTIIGLFSSGNMAFSKERETGGNQASLADMTRRAIQCLQTNRKGYVLVVNDTLVTQAALQNNGEFLLRETLEVDEALKIASEYAGDKSLIIAVGKNSTGGFMLSGHPARQDKGITILGPTPSGHPTITWASGPKNPTEPTALGVDSPLSNTEDVIALARGIGSEKIKGFMDNTAVFQVIKDGL